MIAVFDSSPWIFLSKLGFVDKAIDLFDHVLVPSSVEEEISQKRDRARDILQEALAAGKVKITTASNPRFVAALRRRLGKGESETIVIGLELKADMVILDDHAARTEARRLGLQVKGTLGLIRKLRDSGTIKLDEGNLYARLQEIGFRVRKDIYLEIFR